MEAIDSAAARAVSGGVLELARFFEALERCRQGERPGRGGLFDEWVD